MAKLPLILSIVALLCATGLGIAAKGKADKKVQELAATRTELKGTVTALTQKTTELGKANESLAASEKEVEAKTAEVAKLNGDVKTGQEKLVAATETAKTQEEKVTKLETEVNEGKAKLEAELIAKTMLESELKDTKNTLKEVQLALEQYRNRPPVVQNDVPSKPASPVAPSPNLTGSVLAVNQGLNFLVLSVGDRQGVSVNTSMLVVRGNQRVARLKVTSIEPRTSIAEVVPGSMAKGQAVQTGDRVVLVKGEQKSPAIVPTRAGRSLRGGETVEPVLPEA